MAPHLLLHPPCPSRPPRATCGAFPFFRESAHDVFCRDVAQLTLGNHAPLLLEVAITPLELQPRLRGPMRGHVSIFQLAPVTQDLQGRLCRARLARRVTTLVAPPDQVGCHPNCLKEAHRREGRGLGVEPVLPIPESQVPGTILPAAAGVSQRSARSSTVTYPDAPRAAWVAQAISLPTRMAASGLCNFATSSLNSAGTSSGGLAAMTSDLGVGGWVFHTNWVQRTQGKA